METEQHPPAPLPAESSGAGQDPPSAPPLPDEHAPKPEEGQAPPETQPTPASSNAMVVFNTAEDAGVKDRDVVLAKATQERTLSHIRAWEENEKAKSLNKYNKEVSKITAWENTRKATAEAKLKKAEEALEKQKAAYVEKMKNEVAAVHREAEDKRAISEAKKGEELVRAEESAAKYRALGQAPRKFFCCGA